MKYLLEDKNLCQMNTLFDIQYSKIKIGLYVNPEFKSQNSQIHGKNVHPPLIHHGLLLF